MTGLKQFNALALLALSPLLAIADGSVSALKQFKDTVRVAVAQITLKREEFKPGQDTVDSLVPWMQRAAVEKADLLVFPEYLLGDFHLPDKLTDKLCESAKRLNLNVIVGGWEYLPGKSIQHPPEIGRAHV